MKGIVFTEFLEMVEQKFQPEMVDTIIDRSRLPSGGAYTSVGTYDHREIVELVGQLSAVTGSPVPDLVRTFGRHLFGRFTQLFPQYFEGIGSALEFLPKVHDYIHVEVLKLYPDAELPSFECHPEGRGGMVMIYRSSHPFPDLAEGLILGCVEHFRDPVQVCREDFRDVGGAATRFVLSPPRN
jgi:hypothetical protein